LAVGVAPPPLGRSFAQLLAEATLYDTSIGGHRASPGAQSIGG
jgi:hypothetical protein